MTSARTLAVTLRNLIAPVFGLARHDRCPHVVPCATVASCLADLERRLEVLLAGEADPTAEYLRLVDQVKHKTVGR